MSKKKQMNAEDDKEKNAASYHINDPEKLGRNLLKVLEKSSKTLTTYLDKSNSQTGPYSATNEIEKATQALGPVAQYWMTNPALYAEAQSKLVSSYMDLAGQSFKRFLGEGVEPVAEPGPGDKRFRDEDWSENPFFDFWKQSYLITSQWAGDILENSDGIDDKTKKKAEFYLDQIASALSPSNFVLTNPEVMRETLATNGENLLTGIDQLSEDLNQSSNLFKISQTDIDAFEVGKNLAITPGKVIFQNDILQLIQYKPSTKTVYETPLLMIPPWINKYYILDLVPEKSFIAWAIAEGFTVYIISWVDPDKNHADLSFEDYMIEGAMAATDAVIRSSKVPQINVLGYCVGGTLLASTLAYMAELKDDRIKSATFLTTQVDFSEAGDLLLFIDDQQLNSLEEMMNEKGYLDGSRMASAFNLLRPQDLIWPYVVNNYLMGKKPFPFDLLYWNQDSTRLPAANHAFYLREFYHENKLAKGALELAGKTLDLSKIKLPIYELAAREDHIAPAKSVFIGSKLFSGPVKFVLSGSGHIAGVINPPVKEKYQYWTNRKKSKTLDDWVDGATMHDGSWWPDWSKWLAKNSGKRVPARHPGKGPLKALEDAPGSYVKERKSED